MKRNQLVLFMLLLLSSWAFSQTNFTGTVYDSEGQPAISATILLNGNPRALTNFDGQYTLESVNVGDMIQASYVGTLSEPHTVAAGETTFNFRLAPDNTIDDIVVIGYGEVKKEDLTGSVEAFTTKDFNKGPIVNATQLIQGKAAGVSVSAPGGAPGSGSIVRVRGLSSITENSDPLFIIDGVPLERGNGPSGSRNPLNFINPNDIESISVLKDASATAIYGARASAGVIIITTKSGGKTFEVNYNGQVQVSSPIALNDVLSADEFRSVVNERGNANQIGFLGNQNTNWQDEIFQDAIGTQHDVSLSGSLKLGSQRIPMRLSTGYGHYDGMIKTGTFERFTTAVNIRPTFFDESLKVSVNAKYARENNQFANTAALTQALLADPTQAVKNNDPIYDRFGGYFHPTAPGATDPLFISNPVATLNLEDRTGNVNQFVGNVQLDYALPWVKGLSANVNLGLETSDGQSADVISPLLSLEDNSLGFTGGGGFNDRENQTLESYIKYARAFENLPITTFDVQGGYSWQEFENAGGGVNIQPNGSVAQDLAVRDVVNLQAYFGRTNIELFETVLLTGTIRRDGTSRFSENNRWGNFPSAAIAWKVNQQQFLQNADWLSTLKLRASWGITGNQDVGNPYPASAIYQISNAQAQYPINGSINNVLRPNAYNENLKWEETEQINAGIDFGILEGRFTGSFDVYQRDISDLLNTTNFPAGTIPINRFLANIANMQTRGVELGLSGYVIDKADVSVRLGINTTLQDIEVKSLNAVDIDGFVDNRLGEEVALGARGQGLAVGYTPFSYYVYKQVYDDNGNPIENLFADINDDGIINDQDRYLKESPFANWLINFNQEVVYKNLTLNAVWRGSIGNYAMNNQAATWGNYRQLFGQQDNPQNILRDAFNTGFETANLETILSDHYVQNASFLKLDNLTFGYRMPNLDNKRLNMQFTASAQNLLTITEYDGIDPEVGIDRQIYPRPTILLFGINANY